MLIYRATFTDKDGEGPVVMFVAKEGMPRSELWRIAAVAIGGGDCALLGTMRISFVCDTNLLWEGR